MHFAVVVAGALVIWILAACAACWTIAALKVLAVSTVVPESLAALAGQVLRAIQVEPGLPLVAWSSRRPVPWALVDFGVLVALYLVAGIALPLALDGLGWLPDSLDESKMSLPEKGTLVWLNIAISLGLLLVGLPLVALRSGASGTDFGVSVRKLWSDLQLGLIGFVMLAPPVYAIQGVLVSIWKPSKHPMMEMFKTSPDTGFFVVLLLAAAVVAPVFEELMFRVLIQGFLEKVFSFRGSVQEFLFEMVMGTRPQATHDPLIPLPAAIASSPDVLFIPEGPLPNPNRYTPPVIVYDQVVTAELAEDQQQSPLRGLVAWLPIAISSVIFALLHLTHGPDWVALIVLAAGMGYLYQRTHSVVPGLVVHALLNSMSMFGLWLSVYVLPGQGSWTFNAAP